MTSTPPIARLDVRHYQVEIDTPVVTSFGTIPSRTATFLRIEDRDGAHGWGEVWGNFPSITSEYRARLAALLLPNHLIGRDLITPGETTTDLADAFRVLEVQAAEPGPVAAVLAATNQALWDLCARRQGKPLRYLIDTAAADSVPAYASGLNPGDGVETAARARAEGYTAFKLKIGFGDTTDRDNLARIRRDMQPGERLLVDANQRWSPDEARTRIAMLVDHDVAWFEEPMLATEPPQAWQALARDCPIPLAGGENLLNDSELRTATAWLGFIQPDIGKWGGIDGCAAIARQAIAAGKAYCPHWLSGGVGLMHSAQLLAAVGGGGLLEIDTNPNPLRTLLIGNLPGIENGAFRLGSEPGIGIEPPVRHMEPWLRYHETFS